MLVGSPAAPGAAALLPGRDGEQGSLLLGPSSSGQGAGPSPRAGGGHAAQGGKAGAGASGTPVALQAEDACAPAFSS